MSMRTTTALLAVLLLTLCTCTAQVKNATAHSPGQADSPLSGTVNGAKIQPGLGTRHRSKASKRQKAHGAAVLARNKLRRASTSRRKTGRSNRSNTMSQGTEAKAFGLSGEQLAAAIAKVCVGGYLDVRECYHAEATSVCTGSL